MTDQPDQPDRPDPSPRVLGTLLERDGVGVVRLQDRLAADVDDVWRALTRTGRIAQWLGTVEGDLTVGGGFRGHWVASGWEGTCHLEVCEPPRHLLLRTTTGDQPQGVVEVTLEADGDGTTVVLEDRGVPVADLPAYAAGDQVHLEDLTAHLAGRGRCDPRARWAELFAAYRELPVGRG
ncbi:MAG: hypothetical protein JWR42_1233 [Marmoricola sp.]|nr:hypothetical protein [Marmoricola sp.]